jgi:hypothetical protein
MRQSSGCMSAHVIFSVPTRSKAQNVLVAQSTRSVANRKQLRKLKIKIGT